MDLIHDPIPRLLKTLALPASVGMLFSTLYYIVDNYFAGLLSASALAGLAIAAPVYFIGSAIAIGIGQATNAIVGNALGEDNPKKAAHIAGQALSFSWISASLLGLLILWLADDIFAMMQAHGPYIQHAHQYLAIILPTMAISAHGMTANGILNSQGDTRSFRNSLIVAFFANIALNPLFMFTFELGVAGLALATVVTQLGNAIYLSYKIQLTRLRPAWHIQHLKPCLNHYWTITRQALPASLNMLLIAAGSIILTAAVARFGESAVAGLGIGLRIEQLALLPSIGINIAVLSLTSVNYGAGQWVRLRYIANDAIKIGGGLMILGGVLVYSLAHPLVSLFSQQPDVIAIGVSYLRIEALIMPAYVLSFIASAVLQGIKRPTIPMYFNLLRQIVLPMLFIAIALIMFKAPIEGVWWSIAIATWLAVLVQVWHLYYTLSRLSA